MSEWREEPEAPERDWGDVRNKALIGAACAAAVIAWMLFARPGEEASSSRGFNLGSAGGSSGRASRGEADTRPKTSLDMVSSAVGDGPAGVTNNALAPAREAAQVQAGAVEAPRTPAPAPTAAVPPAAAPAAESDASLLAAARIPVDAKGLANLGAREGLLSALAEKLLDHPAVIKALFNNKTLVDAFMSRDTSKRNCESGGALKSYLSDASSGGMTKVFPVIQAALSRPETASALAGTEMAKRVMGCPSVTELAKDPTAIMSIAMSNSKALGLLSDPRLTGALASNPQASSLLAGVQSSMGK